MSTYPIVHVELSTHDREASGKFYSELFGWQVEQLPEMNYATFAPGEGVGGGFNPISDQSPAGTVTIYVGTDDLPGTLARAQSLGATVVASDVEIPGMGWFSLFRDPAGNMIGLYKVMPQE